MSAAARGDGEAPPRRTVDERHLRQIVGGMTDTATGPAADTPTTPLSGGARGGSSRS